MTTINDDLAAIKAALDAGPICGDYWEVSDDGLTIMNFDPLEGGGAWTTDVAHIDRNELTYQKETAVYIAACSPYRIARLVEHVERLEEFARYALSLKTGGMLERKAKEALEGQP